MMNRLKTILFPSPPSCRCLRSTLYPPKAQMRSPTDATPQHSDQRSCGKADQMAASRSCEYLADASGSEICGRQLALAGALRMLHNASKAIPMLLHQESCFQGTEIIQKEKKQNRAAAECHFTAHN
jgi:hypothetical protein